MIVDAGDAEAVDGDLLQIDRRATHFQSARVGQRVVLEEVQQIAVQSGRQTRVVVVPVEDVERRWLLAQQVVVDEVAPDQVVGAHPGEDLGHVAAIQHTFLIGAALGSLQCLLVGEQRSGAVQLTVEQAHQIRRAGHPAQLPLGLQMTLQRGNGQPAGAGTHQVDLPCAGDRPADIHRFFHGFDVGREPPFAVTHIGIAPADHEGLQAVFKGVLDETVVRAQVENVVLVDLRRHHQQGLGILLFAHRLVLDQFQQLVAEHHGAGSSGDCPADLERLLGDLPGQAVVMQQIVHQMADASHQAVTAGIEQLLDRQWVEQGVGGRYGVVEQGEGEVGAGAVVRAHVALVDPAFDLLLPAQIGLQATAIKRVEAPRRVGEASVVRVGRVQGFAQQHATKLTAEFEGMPGAVQWVAQAMGGHTAQGRQQIPATQTGNRTLCIDERGGSR
ncbi:hypothetical protein D3C73_659280 [compost metagenome]